MMGASTTEPLSAPVTETSMVRLVQLAAIKDTESTDSLPSNGVHAQTPLSVTKPPISELVDDRLSYLNRPLPSKGSSTPPAQFTEGFMRRSDQGARLRAESSKAKQSTKPPASQRLSKIVKSVRPKPFPCTSSLSDLQKRDAATLAAFTNQEKHHREPISPPNWNKAVFPPQTPSASHLLHENGCLQWQIRMARHLTFHKQRGPFEIGDFLCNVNRITGDIIKVAKNMLTGGASDPEKTNHDGKTMCGRPISGPGGSFLGFANRKALYQINSSDREARLNPEPEYKSPFRNGKDPMWF
ncbi:hypothetical protein QQZ08_009844 [Neonectria magnoliae]|uniref:Uncharacterized protein n=1 Tax=Neonectria magnoliae TaxID=2732573 RepID=A0ABR1HLB1_9HYPO